MAVVMLGLHGGPEVTTSVTLYQFLAYCLLVIAALLALRVLVTALRPNTTLNRGLAPAPVSRTRHVRRVRPGRRRNTHDSGVGRQEPSPAIQEVPLPGGRHLRAPRQLEAVGLAAGTAQDEHDQIPQSIAKRMFPAQRLQFAYELAVTAQHQVSFDTGLDRHQGQLGEMRSFGISEACVRELGERLPPSQT